MTLSDSQKQHLESAAITFVVAFGMAAEPLLSNYSAVGLGKDALFALVAAGLRAGVKALWKLFLSWSASKA